MALEDEEKQLDVSEFVVELRQMERRIRRKYHRRRTLREQLEDAIKIEDYEQAARIRDQLGELQSQ